MIIGNLVFGYCLIRKYFLNMILKILVIYKIIVIIVNVYIVMRKIVFFKCFGIMYCIIVNFFLRDLVLYR